MNYLTLENISKSYGERTIFSNITLKINQSDKVAVVARNGSGKSSLLRIAAGLDLPEGEHAKFYVNPDIRTAYLDQEPQFHDDHTILQAILSKNQRWLQPLKAYHDAHRSNDLFAMEHALQLMETNLAWDLEVRLKELLTKFKLPGFHAPVKHLSGGQKKRLALIQVLGANPDFLILDEPTNHLDMEMIEWLEKHLDQPNLTILMVTHDRYFLNRLCNQILELDQGMLFKYSGDYEDFLEKKAARIHNENTLFNKTTKLLRKELDWLRKMPKARTTKNKARVERYHWLKNSLQQAPQSDSMEFEFDIPRLGTKILELHHVQKSFGDFTFVSNFSYKFKPGDRIGIIGPNGAGKTSFVKLLLQELKPDKGKIVFGDTLKIGCYAQVGLQNADDKKVIDVLRQIADYIPLKKGRKLSAESLLERFLFPRSQQQVYVSKLSGGEKRRLYLLTVLVQNPNFLILDEPTNDLDIITLNLLEEYLLEFPGCILIISHDRYFMDKIAQHLFVMKGNGVISDFPGSYTHYRDSITHNASENGKPPGATNASKKAAKKANAQEKKEMIRLEKEIDLLHSSREELVAEFGKANMPKDEIGRIQKRLTEIQQQMSEKERRWLELAEALSIT